MANHHQRILLEGSVLVSSESPLVAVDPTRCLELSRRAEGSYQTVVT
jgi:hypothetical protein